MNELPSGDTIVEVFNLTMRFGKVEALKGVDLKIRKGEFFSLLGPSGCGKTTLLRLLAGFELPSSGDIWIDRRDVSEVPAHRRPVNTVFQNYAIFPHLDIGRNIAFGLRKSGLTKKEIAARVEHMLELIKLPGYASRSPRQLSGGQRQRVALARALVLEPKVLLLDEPLGALDRKLREEMQIELRTLQQRLQTTFVFVTHDQDEALAMSDRIAVMVNGQVEQVAAPTDLYERPASRFVATFIGQMNFFEGVVKEVSGANMRVEAAPFGRITVEAGDDAAVVGQEMTIGIRPERLRAQLERPDGACCKGTVTSVSYLGDRSQLHVSVAGREDPIIFTSPSEGRQHQVNGSDTTVWLTWPDDAFVPIGR